jgi:hypothetical protein
MADKQLTQTAEDLATVYKTLLLDLPLAATKWGLGLGVQQETTETAWKAYDASVRLTSTTVDTLYRAPLFGDIAARSLNVFLRGQQMRNALAGVFFTGLWQSVGLPTSTDVQTMRAEVQGLRDDVRALNLGVQVRKKQAAAAKPQGAAAKPQGQDRTAPADVSLNGDGHPLRAAA